MSLDLTNIQNELKVAKKKKNDFGKYFYRSADDIYEAVKPLLLKYKCTIRIEDDVVLVGNRYYVCSTVYFTDSEGNVETHKSYAREPETKKGMDEAQITGATISYCKKYALGGLLLIDDTEDFDAINDHNTGEELITTKQYERLKTIIAKNNISTESVLEFIKTYGYANGSSIKVKDYAEICKKIETLKPK